LLIETIKNLLDYGEHKGTTRIVFALESHGLIDYLQARLPEEESYRLDRIHEQLQQHEPMM